MSRDVATDPKVKASASEKSSSAEKKSARGQARRTFEQRNQTKDLPEEQSRKASSRGEARTPWRRAGDAEGDAGELLLGRVRLQLVGLGWRRGGHRVPSAAAPAAAENQGLLTPLAPSVTQSRRASSKKLPDRRESDSPVQTEGFL